MRRRLTVLLAALLLLSGVTVFLWTALSWPPPRLLLKYGLPSSQGPTGQTYEVEGVEFVEISEGYFRMGSHFGCEEGDLLGRISAAAGLSLGRQPNHEGEECPPYWVEFARPLWMARTEVTTRQYREFDPSHRQHEWTLEDWHPVGKVRWEKARDYCVWLSGRAGRTVRLPSEEEWSYTCRDLEPGSCKSNRLGLKDMHMNVWEWCDGGGHVGDQGGREQPLRRGGWWTRRRTAPPGLEARKVGFRPVFTLPPGK